MIPFPGESMPIFQGWSAAGDDYTLAGDVVYRGAEVDGYDGFRAITAGDQWRAWVGMGGLDYLDDPADCDGTPKWVVVVDSGSAVVTASEGQDDGFGDTTAAHPTALGTFTLAPGDNVIPSAFTVTDVLDGPSSMMLVLDAVSGSAVVSQIKLRVWPAAGPLGGWSDVKPSWHGSTLASPLRRASFVFTGSESNVDPEASWDAARAEFDASVSSVSAEQTRNLLTTTPAFGVGYFRQMAYDLTVYSTLLRTTGNLILLGSVSAGGRIPIDTGAYEEEVDWVRPPDEVYGDAFRYADTSTDPAPEWVTASITINATGALGSPTMAATAAPAGTWWNTPSVALANAPAVGSGVYALPTTGEQILVELSHTTATGDIGDWPGWVPPFALGTGSISDSGAATYTIDASSRVVFAPYRIWDPTAQPQAPLKLITRRDSLGMGSGALLGADTRQNSSRLLASP